MTAQQIALIRGGLILLAVLFEVGTLPTYVDGGGHKVAATCAVVAAMLAAGEKNPKDPTDGA